MDRVDRHDAALAQRAERSHDDRAGGRERYGTIESSEVASIVRPTQSAPSFSAKSR